MNGARGETSIRLADQRFTLCLTLGALAEIETALGCRSLDELELRFKSLSAAEMQLVLTSLLRAGGTPEAELADACISQFNPADASRAIADAFTAALA